MIHPEVQDWVKKFAKIYRTSNSPTKIVNSLVQLGVDDPNGHCNCDMDWVKEKTDEGLWSWLHENHKEYNQMILTILMTRPDMFPKLRRVLVNDLKTESSKGFGEIISHNYARWFLENFLTKKRGN